jgi:hypothetical protein
MKIINKIRLLKNKKSNKNLIIFSFSLPFFRYNSFLVFKVVCFYDEINKQNFFVKLCVKNKNSEKNADFHETRNNKFKKAKKKSELI